MRGWALHTQADRLELGKGAKWAYEQMRERESKEDGEGGVKESKEAGRIRNYGVGEGATPFLGLLHFTFDPYLIILSAKQGRIKYLFFGLWYDSIWYWTFVSRTIGWIWIKKIFDFVMSKQFHWYLLITTFLTEEFYVISRQWRSRKN